MLGSSDFAVVGAAEGSVIDGTCVKSHAYIVQDTTKQHALQDSLLKRVVDSSPTYTELSS